MWKACGVAAREKGEDPAGFLKFYGALWNSYKNTQRGGWYHHKASFKDFSMILGIWRGLSQLNTGQCWPNIQEGQEEWPWKLQDCQSHVSAWWNYGQDYSGSYWKTPEGHNEKHVFHIEKCHSHQSQPVWAHVKPNFFLWRGNPSSWSREASCDLFGFP